MGRVARSSLLFLAACGSGCLGLIVGRPTPAIVAEPYDPRAPPPDLATVCPWCGPQDGSPSEDDTAEEAFSVATKAGGKEAYERFLKEHPKSRHAPAAKKALADIQWATLVKAWNAPAIEKYVAAFPKGFYTNWARLSLKGFAWQQAHRDDVKQRETVLKKARSSATSHPKIVTLGPEVIDFSNGILYLYFRTLVTPDGPVVFSEQVNQIAERRERMRSACEILKRRVPEIEECLIPNYEVDNQSHFPSKALAWLDAATKLYFRPWQSGGEVDLERMREHLGRVMQALDQAIVMKGAAPTAHQRYLIERLNELLMKIGADDLAAYYRWAASSGSAPRPRPNLPVQKGETWAGIYVCQPFYVGGGPPRAGDPIEFKATLRIVGARSASERGPDEAPPKRGLPVDEAMGVLTMSGPCVASPGLSCATPEITTARYVRIERRRLGDFRTKNETDGIAAETVQWIREGAGSLLGKFEHRSGPEYDRIIKQAADAPLEGAVSDGHFASVVADTTFAAVAYAWFNMTAWSCGKFRLEHAAPRSNVASGLPR